MPRPLAIGLVGEGCLVAISHIAVLTRPRQVVCDQQVLAGGIAGTQVDECETERAGHNGVGAKFSAKSRPVYGRRAAEVAHAEGVPRREVVVEPRLTVGEAENKRRLVTEIDPIDNVLEVAFAESR